MAENKEVELLEADDDQTQHDRIVTYEADHDAAHEPEEIEVENAEEEPEPEVVSADDGIEALRKERDARQRLEREREDHIRERASWEQRQRASAIDNHIRELDGHINTLSTAKQALDAKVSLLKREWAEQGRRGDYDAQAEVQAQLSQAAAELAQITQGSFNLDQKRREAEWYRQQPQQPPQQTRQEVQPAQQQDGLTAWMERLPKDSPTLTWAKKNETHLRDPRKAMKAQGAHTLAVADGIVPETPEYFSFVEKHMGIGRSLVPSRKPPAVAPVARSGGGAVSTTRPDAVTKVKLSNDQRSHAKEMGMTYEEYARGVIHARKRGINI